MSAGTKVRVKARDSAPCTCGRGHAFVRCSACRITSGDLGDCAVANDEAAQVAIQAGWKVYGYNGARQTRCPECQS